MKAGASKDSVRTGSGWDLAVLQLWTAIGASFEGASPSISAPPTFSSRAAIVAWLLLLLSGMNGQQTVTLPTPRPEAKR